LLSISENFVTINSTADPLDLGITLPQSSPPPLPSPGSPPLPLPSGRGGEGRARGGEARVPSLFIVYLVRGYQGAQKGTAARQRADVPEIQKSPGRPTFSPPPPTHSKDSLYLLNK